MSNSQSDKKTVIVISSVFAVVAAAMLLLIPLELKNERYEKWRELAKTAENDERAQFIIDNEELYPENILNLFYANNDNLDYVYNYPFFKDSYKTMSFTDEELNGDTIPALYMDDYRWSYEDGGYVKGSGCVAVTITMANLYVNHNSDIDPVKIMRYADEMGYYGLGGIGEANINNILDNFKIKYDEYIFDKENNENTLSETELKTALDLSGTAVIAAVHGSTFGNHAFIIRGYDENGFYINDPASEEKTAQIWNYETFANELVHYWIIYPN